MRQFWRNFRAQKIPITVNRRRGSFFFIVLSSLKGYLSISFCYSFVWLAIPKYCLQVTANANWIWVAWQFALTQKKLFTSSWGRGKTTAKFFSPAKLVSLGELFVVNPSRVCPCAVVFQHRAKIILSSLYFRGLMPLPPLVIYNVKPKFVCVVPPLLLLVLRGCSTD